MKSKNPIAGIYKITSPIGMVYIGQSLDIRRRWVSHKGLQCKGELALRNSLMTYGVDAHAFEIVEYCDDKPILNELERLWQEKYYPLKSLNTALVGTATKKQVHSPETLKKISSGNKGKIKGVKKAAETIEKRIATLLKNNASKRLYDTIRTRTSGNKGYPVIQLSKDGDFIKEWVNKVEASRALKINPHSIRNVIIGKQELTGGFKWDAKHPEHKFNTKNVL